MGGAYVLTRKYEIELSALGGSSPREKLYIVEVQYLARPSEPSYRQYDWLGTFAETDENWPQSKARAEAHASSRRAEAKHRSNYQLINTPR